MKAERILDFAPEEKIKKIIKQVFGMLEDKRSWDWSIRNPSFGMPNGEGEWNGRVIYDELVLIGEYKNFKKPFRIDALFDNPKRFAAAFLRPLSPEDPGDFRFLKLCFSFDDEEHYLDGEKIGQISPFGSELIRRIENYLNEVCGDLLKQKIEEEEAFEQQEQEKKRKKSNRAAGALMSYLED